MSEHVRQRVMEILSGLDTDSPADWALFEPLLSTMAETARAHEWTPEQTFSTISYDFCARVSADYIKAGKPLPELLADFVLGVLAGRVVRWNRGPDALANARRDAVIYSAVYAAVCEGGLQPYRNDERRSGGISACDLVSDCLADMGRKGLGYKTVAKIWAETPEPLRQPK